MASSVGAIAAGNIASKAVGLVRELLFASWFGTGETATAYRIAQTTYLIPIQALVGDSLSAGLLPLYKKSQNHSADSARNLLLIATLYALAVSLVVSTILYVFAKNVAGVVAPGASANALSLASSLLKIMALSTPFFILSGMLSYIEAAHGKYGAIAWRPMLLNIGSMSGAGIAVWLRQDVWLAIGVLASHVGLFLWTLLQLRRIGSVWPKGVPGRREATEISTVFMRHLAPLLGLPLIAQLNVLVERMISSQIGVGVIPSVDYARFLCDTAVQVIAMPLGVLTMSKMAGANPRTMHAHVVSATKATLSIAFPIGAFTSLNSEFIVRILFGRGAFNEHSIALTSTALTWMAAGLGMTITSYYLIKALNAQLRNREALFITAMAVAANIMVNTLLWRQIGAGTPGLGIAAYSAVLMTLGLSRLKLWRDVFPLLTWLSVGCLIQIVATKTLAPRFKLGNEIVPIILMTSVIWLTLFLSVPELRRALSPLIPEFIKKRFNVT
ncbi:lipid II flippase MurJ [Stenotrophomonas sp. TWI700]|uniref:murein biosynthesis integral membrane protein MurJ n=1 Tax=unclassified Stenotrophomonas TaxID=196198 RepID=UPI0028AA0D75|nr:lipid II flippase MurJ [Stenotrophomonas sp.]